MTTKFWSTVLLLGQWGLKLAKGIVVAWLLLVATERQKESIRDYWISQWTKICLPWSKNAKFIANHWREREEGVKDFIIAGGRTGAKNTICNSRWAHLRLLSAVGELIVVEQPRRNFQLLWGINDAVILLLVGEWIRAMIEKQVIAGGNTE